MCHRHFYSSIPHIKVSAWSSKRTRKIKSSGMWHCVTGWVVPDVSKEHSILIVWAVPQGTYVTSECQESLSQCSVSPWLIQFVLLGVCIIILQMLIFNTYCRCCPLFLFFQIMVSLFSKEAYFSGTMVVVVWNSCTEGCME